MRKKTIIRKNSRPNPLPIDTQKFEIPESFFSQLSEFTQGGYILITTPAGGGMPEIHSDFDNPTTMIGMHAFAKEYFNVSTKNMESLTDDFMGVGNS